MGCRLVLRLVKALLLLQVKEQALRRDLDENIAKGKWRLLAQVVVLLMLRLSYSSPRRDKNLPLFPLRYPTMQLHEKKGLQRRVVLYERLLLVNAFCFHTLNRCSQSRLPTERAVPRGARGGGAAAPEG